MVCGVYHAHGACLCLGPGTGAVDSLDAFMLLATNIFITSLGCRMPSKRLFIVTKRLMNIWIVCSDLEPGRVAAWQSIWNEAWYAAVYDELKYFPVLDCKGGLSSRQFQAILNMLCPNCQNISICMLETLISPIYKLQVTERIGENYLSSWSPGYSNNPPYVILSTFLPVMNAAKVPFWIVTVYNSPQLIKIASPDFLVKHRHPDSSVSVT